MRKQVIVATTAIVLSISRTTATGTIVAGIGEAMAAETGTKTMPDSNGAGVARTTGRRACALTIILAKTDHRNRQSVL